MAVKQLGVAASRPDDALVYNAGPAVYGPNWMPTGYVPGQYYLPNGLWYPAGTSGGTGQNYVFTLPWSVTATVTIDRMWIDILASTSTWASSYFIPLLFSHNFTTQKPGTLLTQGRRISLGTNSSGDTTYTGIGAYEVSITPLTLSPGWYWIGGVLRGSNGAGCTLRGGSYLTTFPQVFTNATNPGNYFAGGYGASSTSDPINASSLAWTGQSPYGYPAVGVRVAP